MGIGIFFGGRSAVKVMNWAIFVFVLVYGAALSSRRSLDQHARDDLAQRSTQISEHIVIESSAAISHTQSRDFENISHALRVKPN